MTKAELIERIARSRNLPPDITKKDVALILGVAFEELASYFAKARVTRTSSPRFTFPRFGTFTKKKRSARRGVNPRTLEPMLIDASCTVDFKASKELRDQMNGSTAKNSTKSSSRSSTKSPSRASAKSSSRTSSRTSSKTSSRASAASRTTASAEATKKTTARTAAGKTKTAKTSRRRTSSAAKVPVKVPAKVPAKPVRGKRGSDAAKPGVAAPSGRRLTPRDEDAELDALIDDDSLFVELPATRLKRVRPGRNNESGESGTG